MKAVHDATRVYPITPCLMAPRLSNLVCVDFCLTQTQGASSTILPASFQWRRRLVQTRNKYMATCR